MGCLLGSSILPLMNAERDDDRRPNELRRRSCLVEREARRIGLLHRLGE